MDGHPEVNAGIVPLRDNMHMSSRAKTASPFETFQQFATAINSHNVEGLTALMTPDHVFVDSVRNRAHGAASMEFGWRSYFTMCPAWKAVIRDGTVLEWRVFADNKPVYEILARRKP